jgi:predicted metalloprotease with PDZ domain
MLMMAVWSPGMYTLQNYANNLTAFSAKGLDGTELATAQPKPSRWVVKTGGRPPSSPSWSRPTGRPI